MYIPMHFKANELIDRHTYQKYQSRGDKWMLGVLFDDRLLKLIDILREKFGPMTINDWSWGGQSQYRGWRSPGCDIGATLSQHRFGRAVDMIPKDMHPKLIRQDIIKYQSCRPYRHIGGLEMGISWLHIDVRARNSKGEINLFYP